MTTNRKTNCVNHSLAELMPIVSLNETGTYNLTLPGFLRAEQNELEQMLSRIFADQNNCSANLALAQQLSINWCMSKAKKNGLSEKCLCFKY
jgi:hypothetical protein